MFFCIARTFTSRLDWVSVLETLGNRTVYTRKNSRTLINHLNFLVTADFQSKPAPKETQELILTSLELFNVLVPKMTLSDLVLFSQSVLKARISRNHEIFNTLGKTLARQNLKDLKPLEVLDLAKSSAKIPLDSERYWMRLEESLLEHFFQKFAFGPKAFVSLYWAFRCTDQGSEEMFEVLKDGILKHQKYFTTASVQELAEALLVEDSPDRLLVRILVEKIMQAEEDSHSMLEVSPSGLSFVLALLAKVRWEGKELTSIEQIMIKVLEQCDVVDLSRVCHMYGVYLNDYLQEKGPRLNFLCGIEEFIGKNPEKVFNESFSVVFKIFWGLSKKNHFVNKKIFKVFLNVHSKEITEAESPVVEDFLNSMRNKGLII